MHKQHNFVCQHMLSPTLYVTCTNSTTLFANIFMRHQHLYVYMHKQCLPTYFLYVYMQLCANILIFFVRCIFFVCIHAQTGANIFMRHQHLVCIHAQTAQLCANIFMRHQHLYVYMHKQHNFVPTYLCVTNILYVYMHKQHMPTFMRHQHVVCIHAQTAQLCLPTYLCVINMLYVYMRKQHNIVGKVCSPALRKHRENGFQKCEVNNITGNSTEKGLNPYDSAK